MRLGLALFDALDYNKDSNEELLISSELENLIAKITLEEADASIAFTIDEIDNVGVCWSFACRPLRLFGALVRPTFVRRAASIAQRRIMTQLIDEFSVLPV